MKTQSTMGFRGTNTSTAATSLLIMSNGFFASLPLLPGTEMVIGRSTSCDVHLDDPMASRRHARLYLGESAAVEDLGSANGTRVRDALIAPHTRTSIAPGEIISIGSTMLVMQQTGHSNGARRAWSHGYFERRLQDECRHAEHLGARFALVRLHVENAAPWTRVVPVLARELPPPHLFAAYGPQDFEMLLLDGDEAEVERVVDKLRAELAAVDTPTRFGLAWYPRDGRSADALLARANSGVRGSGGEPRGPAIEFGSEAMKRAYDMALRAAPTNISVLLLGETGVGKEVMTRAIHGMSTRADKPFLALNCAGLSEGIIESELFGHEKGSYTGATDSKVGLLEAANGGTLFFDELGEMPLTIQAKLLRVLETREVLPVGARKARPIDVRLIAATNRDLDVEVTRGTFRQDLFYRLNGISITIPPLRERRS
ncbi:MAG TPA: sigma 54-interacting transcriptional regulator, partial [Burkholderiaceae bacterium]|nr:sigma 54-interacting transcriptional regulator [Burkholderiaceae bacterium]